MGSLWSRPSVAHRSPHEDRDPNDDGNQQAIRKLKLDPTGAQTKQQEQRNPCRDGRRERDVCQWENGRTHRHRSSSFVRPIYS